MIVSIILYTACWFIAYVVAKKHYYKNFTTQGKCSIVIGKSKMPLLQIVCISLFCTLYNFYVTTSSSGYGSDRLNYQIAFDIGRAESPALDALMLAVKFAGGTFNDLLYLSTFVTIFIVLLAYRNSRYATPYTLLLLFLTSLVFQSFTSLKQTYTIALATLFFVLLFKKKSLYNDIICVFLVILACLFHVTGYILIPIYIYVRSNIQIKNIKFIILCSIIFVVFFKPIMLIIAQCSEGISPYLSHKILYYFSEDSGISQGRLFPILKGLPFYYITVITMRYSSYLRSRVQNFDVLFLFSMLVSLSYMLSIYDVWMMRMVD